MPIDQADSVPDVGSASDVTKKAADPRAVAQKAIATLIGDIISGTYAPGARLPAERELARKLGASRATLREALRELEGLGLVAARRGSGVVVRPPSSWRLEILPWSVGQGSPNVPGGVLQVVREIMAIRRWLVLGVFDSIGARVKGKSMAVAVDAATAAWEARHDFGRFAELDFEVLRAFASVAESYPLIWLLNSLAPIYVGMAERLAPFGRVADDYLKIYLSVCAALERGDEAEARRLVTEYMNRHDDELNQAINMLTAATG